MYIIYGVHNTVILVCYTHYYFGVDSIDVQYINKIIDIAIISAYCIELQYH